MITVVFDDKNNSKAAYGEELLAKCDGNKYYIATMCVKTDEDKARVEKCRKRREGMDFVTIEQSVAIVGAIDKIKWMDSLLGTGDGTKSALIEDIPKLVYNEMFPDGEEPLLHKEVENKILFGLAFLKEFFENIIIVSDEAVKLSDFDNTKSDKDVAEYTEAMKEVNAALKVYAETVC